MATRFVKVLELAGELQLARYAAERAEHEKKLAARQERAQRGERPRGRPPIPPSPAPQPREQTNFTDPHSWIMKSGSGHVQACNARAAVEVDSRPSATTLAPGIRSAGAP